MKIKDELEYAPGQIANKVIARNASGMVIMMAFDKDAALDRKSTRLNSSHRP